MWKIKKSKILIIIVGIPAHATNICHIGNDEEWNNNHDDWNGYDDCPMLFYIRIVSGKEIYSKNDSDNMKEKCTNISQNNSCYMWILIEGSSTACADSISQRHQCSAFSTKYSCIHILLSAWLTAHIVHSGSALGTKLWFIIQLISAVTAKLNHELFLIRWCQVDSTTWTELITAWNCWSAAFAWISLCSFLCRNCASTIRTELIAFRNLVATGFTESGFSSRFCFRNCISTSRTEFWLSDQSVTAIFTEWIKIISRWRNVRCCLWVKIDCYYILGCDEIIYYCCREKENYQNN